MKILIKHVMLFLFAILFSTSCDFSEECIYFGTLKGSVDWSHVGQEVPLVNDMNLFINPLTGEGIGKVSVVPESLGLENGQIFRRELWIGTYDVLIYNPTVLGLVNSKDKEPFLSLSTISKDGKKFVEKELSPVFAAGSGDIVINHEDTTQLLITPSLFVQELEFNIRVKNVINSQVHRVDGVLDGVSTGKYLMRKSVTDESASQGFFTEKKEPFAENLYSGSFYLLGVHPVTTNTLIIKLLFTDGNELFTSVDLSEQLKSFTGEKAVIGIDVQTGELSTTAEIKDWEEVDWGKLSNNHN